MARISSVEGAKSAKSFLSCTTVNGREYTDPRGWKEDKERSSASKRKRNVPVGRTQSSEKMKKLCSRSGEVQGISVRWMVRTSLNPLTNHLGEILAL